MPSTGVEFRLENPEEIQQAFRQWPKETAQMIRQELKRGAKRYEKEIKRRAFTGRPGIFLPARQKRRGAKASDVNKARARQVKGHVVWNSDRAAILVARVSKFAGYHQDAGKDIPVEAAAKSILPKVIQNIRGIPERAFKRAQVGVASIRGLFGV